MSPFGFLRGWGHLHCPYVAISTGTAVKCSDRSGKVVSRLCFLPSWLQVQDDCCSHVFSFPAMLPLQDNSSDCTTGLVWNCFVKSTLYLPWGEANALSSWTSELPRPELCPRQRTPAERSGWGGGGRRGEAPPRLLAWQTLGFCRRWDTHSPPSVPALVALLGESALLIQLLPLQTAGNLTAHPGVRAWETLKGDSKIQVITVPGRERRYSGTSRTQTSTPYSLTTVLQSSPAGLFISSRSQGLVPIPLCPPQVPTVFSKHSTTV